MNLIYHNHNRIVLNPTNAGIINFSQFDLSQSKTNVLDALADQIIN